MGPQFSGGRAEVCQTLRFRPKLARSSELISSAKVPDVGARWRGGSEISTFPQTGGPASIPITRSVEEYPSGHHRIPSSSFCFRCMSQNSENGRNSQGFLPFPRGFQKLKIWPQISRPLIIREWRFGVGSTRGLGPYLTS